MDQQQEQTGTNPSHPQKTPEVNPNIAPATPNPYREGQNFDRDNRPAEINPGKFDREEIDLDRTGVDNSKGHEPYEFKKEQTPNVNKSSEKNSSPSWGKSVEDEKDTEGKLVGQGGYGTSGTSGTNSGGNQGHQSGIGSAGSQNGSTGYNAGSLGEHSEGYHHVNKKVDINKLGGGVQPAPEASPDIE